MPLKRNDKIQLVDDYARYINNSSGFYVFQYLGLSVGKVTDLRNQIRKADGKMFVVKNRMLKRAIEGKDYRDEIHDLLVGPNAVLFAGEDPVASAKALVEFAKDNDVIEIKTGVVGDSVMDAKKIESLSKIPSQEVLYAKILGGIKSPPSAVLGCIKGMPNKLHGLMVAYAKKLEDEAA